MILFLLNTLQTAFQDKCKWHTFYWLLNIKFRSLWCTCVCVCTIILLDHIVVSKSIWSKAMHIQKSSKYYRSAPQKVCIDFHFHQVQKRWLIFPHPPLTWIVTYLCQSHGSLYIYLLVLNSLNSCSVLFSLLIFSSEQSLILDETGYWFIYCTGFSKN